MSTTNTYRGYRLFVQDFGVGWKIFIYAPGTNIALPTSPNMQDLNGQDTIFREARAIVDAELGPKS